MTAGVAGAQAPRFVLDYQAPEGCPDAGRFADEAAARLGDSPFVPSGASGARVRVLFDGSLYVGTLALPAYETRSMSDTDCAVLVESLAAAVAVQLGAVPVPPPPVQQVSSSAPGRVQLELTSSGEDRLALHRVVGSTTIAVATSRGVAYGVGLSFESVCEAPCTASIEPGQHRFAISRNDSQPVALRAPVSIGGDARFELGYVSRQDERVAGLLVGIIGPVVGAGIALSIFALPQGPGGLTCNTVAECDAVGMERPMWRCGGPFCEEPEAAVALIVAGSVVGLASLVTGFALMFRGDTPTMTPTGELQLGSVSEGSDAQLALTRDGVGILF